MVEAVCVSTRLRINPFRPYNPIMDGKSFICQCPSEFLTFQLTRCWPVYHYICDILESDSNRNVYKNFAALKKAVVDPMTKIPNTHLNIASNWFRERVHAVLRLMADTMNDVILCVCVYLHRMLTGKKCFITSVCFYLQT